MKKSVNFKKGWRAILFASLIFFSSQINNAHSQEGTIDVVPDETVDGSVVLNPGYISGAISLGGEDISYIYLRAISGEYNATMFQYAEGNYTLTVNVPPDSSLDYSLDNYVYMDNYQDRLYFKKVTATVTAGETTHIDFVTDAGRITGAISSDCEIHSGRIDAILDSDGNYTRANTVIASDGSFSFALQPNMNIRLYGNVKLSSGANMNLESQFINVNPGEEKTVNWTVQCSGDLLGSIENSVSITGAGSIDNHNSYLYDPSGKFHEAKSHDGFASFNNLIEGDWRLIVYSYLNGYDDFLRHPYSSYDFPIFVPSGSIAYANIFTTPAALNGTIQLKGTATVEDANSISINAYGKYGTPSYGGFSSDRINLTDGSFDLVLPAGDWEVFSTYFGFYSVEPYLRSYLYMYDYEKRKSPVTVTDGQVVEHPPIVYETGTATIKFSRADGGDFSNPYVYGNCRVYDENQQIINVKQVYGYGLPDGDTASFIGFPGFCEVTAYAYVGGTMTTFGKVSVEIIAGTEIVVDIGGPKLNVEFPEPEYATSNSTIMSYGKATDDILVDNVTVNGVEAALSTTENIDDPNEIYYEVNIDLVKGINLIETIATDSSGNSSSDKREVCHDDSLPVLKWSPADGTVISESSFVVQGVVTDDTEVTYITINGKSVEFPSTNNPNDPNEVSFQMEMDLQDGSLVVSVTAMDLCGKTTSESHTITKAEEQFSLTVTTTGSGFGTVTSSDGGINCDGDCTESYPAGTLVTLTATADTGSLFDFWTGGAEGSNARYSITISGDTSVSATFTESEIEPPQENDSLSVSLRMAKVHLNNGLVTIQGDISNMTACNDSKDKLDVQAVLEIENESGNFENVSLVIERARVDCKNGQLDVKGSVNIDNLSLANNPKARVSITESSNNESGFQDIQFETKKNELKFM